MNLKLIETLIYSINFTEKLFKKSTIIVILQSIFEKQTEKLKCSNIIEITNFDIQPTRVNSIWRRLLLFLNRSSM
jgi:hypothetical protein